MNCLFFIIYGWEKKNDWNLKSLDKKFAECIKLLKGLILASKTRVTTNKAPAALVQ